ISFVLGRDAAERIASWDYGAPGVFEAFLGKHRLLVAARRGEYVPARRDRERIGTLPMPSSWDEVSSSEVRRRIACGETWSALVPPGIEALVRDLYGRSNHEESMEQQERQLLMDQLTSSRERLLGLVEGLTEDQWRFQPAEGRWSINQCLEHVTRVEKRVLGSIGKKLEEGRAEPERRTANQKAKDDQIVSRMPDRSSRREAPESARPTGEWADAKRLLEEFRNARQRTLEFAATTQKDLRSYYLSHGAFGDLDCYQWLLVLGLHALRHAGQIEEIKAAPGFPHREE
ncbi:MAG TPA: DinB family protein, partial [Bryobacteraceae bacterium]|nr:DinB family protein [Bryobacteraceae bacterium]